MVAFKDNCNIRRYFYNIQKLIEYILTESIPSPKVESRKLLFKLQKY